MRTLHFVNGEKVSAEECYAAEDRNTYKKKALNAAIKYYGEHPDEFNRICGRFSSSEEIPAELLIIQWSMTPEGSIESSKLKENIAKDTHNSFGCAFLIYTIIIITIILWIASM